MRACFGALGHDQDDPAIKQIRELTDASALPIFGGTLLLFTAERYLLSFQNIFDIIRANPTWRYILTLGEYNEGDRPIFYDLYSRYASASTSINGEVLLCPQTYANGIEQFRLIPTMEYHPLVAGTLIGKSFVETALGQLESSQVWYTTRNVIYVDPHQRFDGMTRRSELEFWYSAAGFLYLAHQTAIIRGYRTQSRRVVVYSRLDLNSYQFIKLIFAFEAIGVELAFVYDEDLALFTDEHRMGNLEIFSRAGSNSLVTIDGEAYYSDKIDVARAINEAQTELVAGRGVYRSTNEFMNAFDKLIINADRQGWRRRGRSAKQLLEKFGSFPLSQQQVVLETYVQRWKEL